MEKLSIIIPVYNVADYLPKCIQNLENLSYKNTEIIFVNDGSTDESGQLLEEYKQKFDNIKVIHQHNNGVSTARNVGIKSRDKCSQYISFVDPDDNFDRDIFDKMINRIKNTNAEICICRTKFYDENGNIIRITKKFPFDILESLNDYAFATEYTHYQAWGAVYKRELIEKIYFDDSIQIGEDALFLLSALSLSHKTVFDNTCYYHYLLHTNSVMNQLNYKKILNEDLAIDKMRQIAMKYPKFYKTFEVWVATHAYSNLTYLYENDIIDIKFCNKMKKQLRKKFIKVIIALKITNIKTLILFLSMVISPQIYCRIHRRKR